MQWGPESIPPGGYPEELAAFVAARGTGGPAVLWPEHQPQPADSDAQGSTASWLADRLTALLGGQVTRYPYEPIPLTISQLRSDLGDFLLIQWEGVSDIVVSTPSGPGDPAGNGSGTLAVRLLAGEVLFLPSRSTAVFSHGPGTRQILLRITAGPARTAAR